MIFIRYLTKNILLSFSVTTLVLLVILFSNLAVRLLTDIQEDGVYSGYLLPIIAFNLLDDLPVLLPICLLISIILAFNKMHRNSEIIAMQALGVGFKDFVQAVLMIALPVCIFVAGLSLYVAPISKSISNQYRYEFDLGNQLQSLLAKSFTLSRDHKNVIYVDENNQARSEISVQDNLTEDNDWPMRGIFIFSELKQKNQERIIVAEKGKQIIKPAHHQEARFLVLNNGEIYTFENNQLIEFMNYELYETILGVQTETYNRSHSYSTIHSKDLLISSNHRYQAEFYWRLSLPIAFVLAGFLALALISFKPRNYSLKPLFIGMLIYIFYHNILFNARWWSADFVFAPWLPFLLIHFLMVLFIFSLLMVQRGYLGFILSFLKIPKMKRKKDV